MRAMKILTALAILSIAGQANAQLIDASLAPAPVAAATDTTADTMAMNSLAEAQAGASITVDPANRAAVAALYFSTYLPEDNATNGWTGSITGCNAGYTATAFQAATLERINVYRAMAGLPGNVVLYPGTANQSADQQAALMMVANNALNHTPPNTWKCYTAAGGDANSGASVHSNLTLGSGFNYNGPTAIDGYMDDGGGGNEGAGHRRWLLFPPQTQVATGDIDGTSGSSGRSSNALWVIGGFSNSRPPTPAGIVWPPRGYIPYTMMPSGSNRWSLSIQNANFANASVSMTRNGAALATPKIDGFVYNGQPNGSYMGDNTIVWEPAGVTYTKPAQDVVYHVTVSGIAGSPTSVSYDVIMFDPATRADPIYDDGFGN